LEGDLLKTIEDENDEDDDDWVGAGPNASARDMAKEGLALASENWRGEYICAT